MTIRFFLRMGFVSGEWRRPGQRGQTLVSLSEALKTQKRGDSHKKRPQWVGSPSSTIDSCTEAVGLHHPWTSQPLFGWASQSIGELFVFPWKVWRVLTTAYGLMSAPISWYERLRKTLETFGLLKMKNENRVNELYDENQSLCGLLAVHVDNRIMGGMNFLTSCVETFKASSK